MITIREQSRITEMVKEYLRGNSENTELYSEIYNSIEQEVSNRARKFIVSTNKSSLLVDIEQYISVALYEGFHKAIESYTVNKNKNFIPYLYTCVDNALKTQLGKDNADKRKINEQAVTYSALTASTEEQGIGLDYLECFKEKNSAEDMALEINPLAIIFEEYGKKYGKDKLAVLEAYEIEKQADRTKRINEILGLGSETVLCDKAKKKVERIKKQFKEFMIIKQKELMAQY